MPFYHYVASDKKGTRVEGTIQAASTDEANKQLALRGFRLLSIADPHAGLSIPPRPQGPTQIRCKRGTDRQRFFLFAQIADLLKVGVAPAQGFATLASRQSNPGFIESLQRIASISTEGGRMSDVMATYPDLYPPHVVGLVRAGEVGGFLPEACAAVSEQAGSAHKFKIFHYFLWISVFNMLLSFPLVWVGVKAFNLTFWKSWNSGTSIDFSWVMGAYMRSLGELCRGVDGIVIFGFFAALVVGLWYWHRPRCMHARHHLGLVYPIYGKRATHEGVTIFSWSLGLLTRSGVPPQTAWGYATDCVPNLALRDRLAEAGRIMQTNTRISEVVFRSKVFPEDYASVVSTGEMVGSVPDTMERLAQISRGEYESQTNYAKMRAGCWSCLLLVVSFIGTTAVLYYLYGKLLTDIANHGAD